MRLRLLLAVISAVFLLSACSTQRLAVGCDHAGQDLEQAIKLYEEGDYAIAIVILHHALQNGLRGKSDQARAYKYIAFIHCISNREKQCRDAFKKAFEVDPGFELKPAESGHPVWGPVFRSVQSGRAAK